MKKIYYTIFCILLLSHGVKAQLGFYISNKLLFCKPTNLESKYDRLSFGLYRSATNSEGSRTIDIRTLTGWSNRIGVSYKYNKITYLAEFGVTLEGYATEEIAGFFNDDTYGSSSVNLYVRHYKYFKHHSLGLRYEINPKIAISVKGVYQKKSFPDAFLEIAKIYFPEIPQYFGGPKEMVAEAVYDERSNRAGQNENTTIQLEVDLRYKIWRGLAMEVGYTRGLTPISKISERENWPYQQAITTGLRYDFILKPKHTKK